MFHTPNVTPFAIALVVCKTFLFDHLFNEDGDSLMELLKGNKLSSDGQIHTFLLIEHLKHDCIFQASSWE